MVVAVMSKVPKTSRTPCFYARFLASGVHSRSVPFSRGGGHDGTKHVHTHAYKHNCIRKHIYVYAYASIKHTSTCVHVCAYCTDAHTTHTLPCVHVPCNLNCRHANMNMKMNTYTNMYTHTHTHTYIYIYIFIYPSLISFLPSLMSFLPS
jgi:hypothetical protein